MGGKLLVKLVGAAVREFCGEPVETLVRHYPGISKKYKIIFGPWNHSDLSVSGFR